jgi:hypothetical protein
MSIDSLSDQLRRDLILLEEVQNKVSATKGALLSAIVADPDFVSPLRTNWGQIQLVRKVVWKFRDRAVTEQNKVVDRLDKELKAARKLLKGAEDAAKVAGKATEESSELSLRIVRGDA